jgi:hypothetical protein
MLLFISNYGFELPVVPPLPEPRPFLRVFFRWLVPSELVPELPERGLGEPVDPGDSPPDPVPGEPPPGKPVPDGPAPVPDPELLPALCAKTMETGIRADNNIANTIFFMVSMSFQWPATEPASALNVASAIVIIDGNYGRSSVEQAPGECGRVSERQVQAISEATPPRSTESTRVYVVLS